ncbi:amidase [Halorussus litoreus]|uniref:amidase n=1 Tax=Halorussus litoreus TaxID=1710536 RepID=UPI000E274DEF|nr:amidase [Halorussus litoreus]
MEDPYYTPAVELSSRIRRGETSPVDVVEDFLERIDRRNADVNAYVTTTEESAREAAMEVERAVERGERLGPLAGVPIALKDLYGFKSGVRQTFGSALFGDNVPDHDSTFVERLEDAGAIVLGMTNSPEFGHKGTTDNELFGPTSTPFDLDRNAGGSSGGSAAAVADGLATMAHGGDAGGSLRIPASFSGVYSIKPTYRRVADASRPNAFNGAIGNYVHHGPITRSVEDAALMLDVMAGPHPRDPTCLPDDGTDYRRATERSIDGFEIAYTPDFGTFPVEERVRSVVEDAVGAFERAGATVEEVEFPLDRSHDELTDAWRLSTAVGYATLADAIGREREIDLLEERRAEIADEVVELIERGRDVTAVEYLQVQTLHTEVYDAITDVFERYDALVSPTLACLPVENDADGQTLGPAEIDGQQVDPTIGWCMTHLVNFTGHPAASIPAGFVDGLPVGMQILCPRFADDRTLAVSAAFERARPWVDSYPPR